jgi:hypothetical protein
MSDHVRVLWEREEVGGLLQCVIRDCCTGAELQVRRCPPRESGRSGSQDDDAAIVLREVYPLKSDLYERAIELRTSYEAAES